MRQSYAAGLPPDRFCCLLDELPLHLIAQHARNSLRLKDKEQGPLLLNPDCMVCPAEQLPDEIAKRADLVCGFALQGTVAWVRDPATRNLLPFWLGPELEAAVRNLQHDAQPDPLRGGIREVLLGAGILVPAGYEATRLRNWNEATKRSSVGFCRDGYAAVADLIHPYHIAALRRYYRYLIRNGVIHLGDGQSPRRYIAYNEPVARFFHHQIAATLSAVAGEPLKPSYVYLASYLSGAELKKHTDRKQCEFSVTLCLDFSPEPAFETPWPIRLDAASGSVAIHQALGDGLAYRGTQLPHHRNVLGEGCSSTSIFFHYVAEGFAGSLD